LIGILKLTKGEKMNQQNYPQNANYNVPATSTLAIVSLVAALSGFTIFPLIGSIIAIVAGYAARKETRAAPPLAGGDGLATAGIIMGWIQVVLMVVGICCFIAWFVFIAGAAVVSGNQ
jgi:hypothetical protein